MLRIAGQAVGFLMAVVLVAALTGCVRPGVPAPERAMRAVSAPTLSDDLELAPLLQAVQAQLAWLEKKPDSYQLNFGRDRYSKAQYLAGLQHFVELAQNTPQRAEFFRKVRDDFKFYQVYGDRYWGDVFITSYFEPVYEASSKPKGRFSQPLYRLPPDLFNLDLAKFSEKFKFERKLSARLAGNNILPYYSRAQIDGEGALRGKGLELCYLDPIEAFVLQIQGSGTVLVDGKSEQRINYAGKNGHEYVAIGKFIKERMPGTDITLQVVEDYLRSLPAAELQPFLDKNPSYVFFQESDKSAVTAIGLPATAGRTIAADRRFFPKGALGFMSFERPARDGLGVAKQPAARFVLDQDVGGAIIGAGRVDLFWGRGKEAGFLAGATKSRGQLYYLAPRLKD